MRDTTATLSLLHLPGAARRDVRRDSDLLKLARDVAPEQPGLAVELRGMALHQSRAAGPSAVTRVAPWWRRAVHNAWLALAAISHARARREMLALAERCDALEPELARELRAACDRPL